MNPGRIKEMLHQSHALLSGHFLLSSGLHSESYLQCARVLQFPKFAEELAIGLEDHFRDQQLDMVVGPAIGGIVLAYETARALNVRNIFAEREQGQMRLRRGFSIEPGDRILVTEDVVTTGGSVKEVIRLLEDMGGVIVGVGSIIDRSGGTADFGYPFHALLTLDVQTFQPGDCPLCAKDIPLTKPGSRTKTV